jgi:hypothetical protein
MLAELESAAGRTPLGVLEVAQQIDDEELGAIGGRIAAAGDGWREQEQQDS